MYHANINFDEGVTGLTASDFIYTYTEGNSTITSSSLTQLSPSSYSFDARASIVGVNFENPAFYIASNSYTDLVGNGGAYTISNALYTGPWW